ncbi:hypothetical protein ACJDT4_12465 [Clostridium neuense]|uniref:Tail fiber protein n=1 Tax=Clostridium neuense TaxID=1728934 RepID=A0ABW8TFH2_9CLOT
MQTTGNYGLKKPDGSDTVDISVLNGNMDMIDTELKKRALVSDIPSSLPANGGNSATVGGFSASGTPSTTEKSNLVGMINELFQSGTNGKNDIYNAISAKGTTPASKNFADLVSAIGNISTGKKYASGTAPTVSSNATYPITGLNFIPSIIILSFTAFNNFYVSCSTDSSSGWRYFSASGSQGLYCETKPTDGSFIIKGDINSDSTNIHWLAIE